MSKLMDKLRKNSTVKETEILADTSLFENVDVVQTQVPCLNIALSGSITGGLMGGLGLVAGPSRHFKSSIVLMLAAAFLKKHADGVILFYDSEFGSKPAYFTSFGIDPSKVLHTPIVDVEQMKTDIMNQLKDLTKEDKVMIIVDSFGNLASAREVQNAIDDKNVADFSRSKSFKSFGRMVTPHLSIKDIPLVAIAHTYETMEMYSKQVIGGGCVFAGTQITMADGTLRNIEDITIGDMVKTLEGDRAVTATWDPATLADGTPECVEVEFEDGYKCICSTTHPFLVNGAWVSAAELVAGTAATKIDGVTINVKSVTSIGQKPVHDISVEGAEHYVLANGAVTHNTGMMYSSNWAIIVGKQQEKDGTDLVGYNFILNIEKSRFVREKSKIPLNVTFEGGISRWSGLLDLALESGHVIKPSNGWYARVNQETGETEDKKWRAKDTDCAEFWGPVLTDPTFNAWVERRYKIANISMIAEDATDAAIEQEYANAAA